jgi:hypothetical protein
MKKGGKRNEEVFVAGFVMNNPVRIPGGVHNFLVAFLLNAAPEDPTQL